MWDEINDRALALFKQKNYAQAILEIEQSGVENLPPPLIINLAKCHYYNRNAEYSLELLSRLDNEHMTQETEIDKALYLNAIGKHNDAMDIYSYLDPNDDKVQFNYGWHYLRKGYFRKGFMMMQHGANLRAWGNEYQYIEEGKLNPDKCWDGQLCHKLLYILEGGFGDQMVFLRWAHYLCRYGDVTVACSQGLLRLLTNAGYDCIPMHMIDKVTYDYYVPAMSLPAIDRNIILPKVYCSFPYISKEVEPFIEKQVNDVCNNEGLKIGIKWFGNPDFEHDQMRTLPEKPLKEITTKYGKVFSFQFEDVDPHILNIGNVTRDWNDTYSYVMSMDVVVTSCTSIAHLCGASGVKCIVLVPLVPYFTWACDEQPWYPSTTTIIRQTEYNDWTEPMKVLDKLLRDFTK